MKKTIIGFLILSLSLVSFGAVGTDDIQSSSTLAASQVQIAENFEDLGFDSTGGYETTGTVQAIANKFQYNLGTSVATLTGDLDVTAGMTINESGADSDTRIEGDTETNLLFIDASADQIGIGTATPSAELDIIGDLEVSGGVNIGSGISFPATQVPSADVNTLDDYEEGTWTPELAIGGSSVGITYSAQGGRYTKIGNMISFSLDCALSSKAALTGALTISLPIAANTPSHPDLVIVALNIDNSNTTEKIQGLIIGSASIISLYSVQPNAVLDNTDINDNSNIRISGTYFTA